MDRVGPVWFRRAFVVHLTPVNESVIAVNMKVMCWQQCQCVA